MLKHIIRVPSLLTATFSEWRRDNPSLLAAALSYYAFFSIIPMLVIAAAIGSLVFGQAAVAGQLASTLNSLFGENVAAVIQSALVNTYSQPSTLIVVSAVAVLLLGASYVFVQLRNALNIIWNVQEQPKQMLKRFLEGRLLSLVMVIGLSITLLLWLSISAAISTFQLNIGNFLVVFVLSALMFALIYKLLPSVRLHWTDVWLGSAVTSLLFTTGEHIFAFYISKVNFASVYGAVGSIAVLLVWLNISAHLFFFGAIFTRVYARRHGSHSITKKKR